MGLSIVLISACESVWIMKASSAVLCCVALFAVAFGSIEDVTPSVLEETSIYHPAANNKVVDAFMGEFAEFDQEEEQLMDVSELSTSLSAKEKKDVWKSYREYTPFGKKGHALAKTNSKGFKAASAKCRNHQRCPEAMLQALLPRTQSLRRALPETHPRAATY